jgi:hypothetical protein
LSPAPTGLSRLLHEAIDYAGLFPPAQLTMPEAVVNFASYRTGHHAWMLGRFITPVAQLDELSDAVRGLRSPPRTPWRISVVSGASLPEDLERVGRFNAEHPGVLFADVVELRVREPEDVAAAGRVVRGMARLFIEFPLDRDPAAFVSAIRAARVSAKVRTGGVIADAVPGSAAVARFLGACADASVSFKATAGLHHALRGEQPLTYDDEPPRAVLHGFLNMLAAAALAKCGVRDDDLVGVLEERDPAAFRFDEGLAWGSHRLSEDELHSARTFMAGFGSCSFTEPIADLTALELL